ncbi:MAG: helix-turn-helix domain-containing protein [Deltaproteobacteria bacterium]|nr:helix-turn-helix domain-containing protein [Deltaproteobacteria bacterium]
MQEPDLKPFFRLLGAQLRKQRMRLGLTQEDMIGHGFSARHWQQIETGRPITLKTLVRACMAFGVLPSTTIKAAEGLVGKPSSVERGRAETPRARRRSARGSRRA